MSDHVAICCHCIDYFLSSPVASLDAQSVDSVAFNYLRLKLDVLLKSRTGNLSKGQ